MSEFSRDYVALFNQAKQIKNLDEMSSLFAELASEAGLSDEAANLTNAAGGKRLAEMLNAKQTGASFEGSVPGKKI